MINRVNLTDKASVHTDDAPTLCVSAAGVVEIDDILRGVSVNGSDIFDMLSEAYTEMLARGVVVPEMDMSDRFAGRVSISIEFLGDVDIKKEVEPDGADALEKAR